MHKELIGIYVAGDTQSGWQNELPDLLKRQIIHHKLQPAPSPQIVYYRCDFHHLKNPFEYTPANLFGVERADILFAYLEESGSAVELAAEIGYARAKGKVVILVNEQDDPHTVFLEEIANFVTDSLSGGSSI